LVESEFDSLGELSELNSLLVPKPHSWGAVEQWSSGAVEQSSSRAVEQSSSRAVEQSSSRAVKRESEKEYIIKREKESERKRESGTAGFIKEDIDKHTSATYFLITEFVETSNELPDAQKLCSWIANIHHESVSHAGKFGFQSPNPHVNRLLPHNDSWATFFKRLLNAVFDHEVQGNGKWAIHQEEAFSVLFEHTLPELLNPLQDGRILKPCLVHGNLSKENIGTSLITGDPVVFNPSALWAHNEYELGIWRRNMGKLGWPFFMEYFRKFPQSEPAEQWDDRIRLYSIKFNLASAIHEPDLLQIRNM
jgi:protein-ribulosamine 3-kinase